MQGILFFGARKFAHTSRFIALALYALPLSIVNPWHIVHRHNVLGGRAIFDTIRTSPFVEKLPVQSDCHAVIGADDIFGVSSLERIAQNSLGQFTGITVFDLKIVPDNYRLLGIKNEKGAFLFSDAARDFAAAELQYAKNTLPNLIAIPKLCLVANFDTSPFSEKQPFSRAREIIEVRKAKGLQTQVIDLR